MKNSTNKFVKTLIMTVALLCYLSQGGMSQSIGDYRSNGNVNLTKTSNWQVYNGSTWVAATSVPSFSNGIVTIANTLTVDVNLVINDTVIMTAGKMTINSGKSITVNSNGYIIHDMNGGYIPVATWNTGSTLKITGITGTKPSNLNQTFYNFIWDCDGQSSNVSFSDAITTVNGDLSFLNTNSKIITLFANNTKTLNIGGDLTIAGNTQVKLTSGSQIITVNLDGNYYQSNGTFDIGGGTDRINLKGNYSNSAGKITKTAGTETLSFCGTSTQYFNSTNSTESLNGINIEVAAGSNLVLSSNMSVLGSNTANQFNVYGTLNMNNKNISLNFPFNVNSTGTLNSGTGILSSADATLNNFQLTTGGTLNIGSPAGITTSGLTGNIQLNGTRTYNAAANYVYSGISQQTPGNGLPSTISGSLTINNSVNFGSSQTVSGTLIMNSGFIEMGTNTLYLTNSNSTALNYFGGFINGKFQRAIAKSTGQYIFPLGISTAISRKVIIDIATASSTSGTITAEFIPSDPGGATGTLNDDGYILDTYSKTGYWRIVDASLTGINYSVSLDAQMFPGVQDYSKLHIIKRANSSSNWYLDGTHLPGSGSNVNPTVYRSVLVTFSEFAIASKSTDNPLDGPLPVELKSFTATVNSNNVKLNWATANEQNNSGFDIERAEVVNQISDYRKIGFVNGNGTTNRVSNYSFNDNNMQSGKYKYRLKQIDYNGNFEYYELNGDVVVSSPAKYNLEQNYPNPFNPITKIGFEIAQDSKVSLKVYDMSGKEVITLVNEFKTAGYYSVNFNGSNLSSGIYFYKIEAGSFSKVLKMALVK